MRLSPVSYNRLLDLQRQQAHPLAGDVTRDSHRLAKAAQTICSLP